MEMLPRVAVRIAAVGDWPAFRLRTCDPGAGREESRTQGFLFMPAPRPVLRGIGIASRRAAKSGVSKAHSLTTRRER